MALPTAAGIHAVRKAARRALARLEVLRQAVGRGSYGRVRKSLRKLIDLSDESRDAEVQRRIVARLKAQLPKIDGRDCDELLLTLTARKGKVVRRLAGNLFSDAGSEYLRRINADLDSLRFAESVVNPSWLALPRYRHALHGIDELLEHKIALGRRVHPLRIRVRRARILASLLAAPRAAGPESLGRDLARLQDSLGDLHDLMLLMQWIKKRGLTVSRQVRRALDSLAEDHLKKCRHCRKPLRRVIRNFFATTRE